MVGKVQTTDVVVDDFTGQRVSPTRTSGSVSPSFNAVPDIVMSVPAFPKYTGWLNSILEPEILGNLNINTGTTLLLKTIVN